MLTCIKELEIIQQSSAVAKLVGILNGWPSQTSDKRRRWPGEQAVTNNKSSSKTPDPMRKNYSSPPRKTFLWLVPALIPLLAGLASAQPNVLVPSDPIIGSSANTPGSEGVKNAIDGTQAKYLNFDGATGPCGFVVTPSVGATWVTGVAMESANDAAERDPKVVTIEGSNDDVADYTVGTWTLIATVNVPAYTARYQWQSFTFSNFTPYKHYKWTTVSCQGPGQNSMQTAEVQLLGVAVPNNVLVPSDPIIGSSANTPGSEGVKNAIDGTHAK